MTPRCPMCHRKVLRVIEQPSTRLYVHEQGAKPAQVYGCAESKVRK